MPPAFSTEYLLQLSSAGTTDFPETFNADPDHHKRFWFTVFLFQFSPKSEKIVDEYQDV